MSTTQTHLAPGHTLRGWLPRGPMSSLTLSWLVFAVSVIAFVGNFFFGTRLPQLGVILSISSFVTCGFSWLLSRALFRADTRFEIWPKLIVAMLFVTCLIRFVVGTAETGGVMGYIGTLHMVIGSAMLFMIPVEALDGLDTTAKERRFRILFTGGYLAIVSVSFALRLPELAAIEDAGCVALASIALIGATAAVRYRQHNPLRQARRVRPREKQETAERNPALAARLQTLMDVERIFLNPELKVAHLAQRLHQPEYRISQCIVQDLGYSNFNQLMNAYRVAEAQKRLSQTEFADCSILVIAMDCGFGSIGPFNRAFKAQAGITPSEFRRQQSV